MPTKTKRGLGLLIVGVALGLVAELLDAAYAGAGGPVEVIAFLAGAASTSCVLAGMTTLLWGLLVDKDSRE